MVEPNWIGVVVATIAGMVIGALWYSKVLFGTPWMKLVGKSESDLKKGAMQAYLVAAVSAFVMACVLGIIIKNADATNLMAGTMMGFWVWLGFVVTTSGVNGIFSGRQKNLYLIEVGHHLVVLLIMGAVLGLMG